MKESYIGLYVNIILTAWLINFPRYITIMAPVLANRSPSTVIDELHFKCLLSAGRQGKVLYEQQTKQANSRGWTDAKVSSPPPPPNPVKRSIFDQFPENTQWFHRFGGDHGSPQSGMYFYSFSFLPH